MPSELSEDSSALRYFFILFLFSLLQGLINKAAESLVGVLVFGLHRG